MKRAIITRSHLRHRRRSCQTANSARLAHRYCRKTGRSIGETASHRPRANRNPTSGRNRSRCPYPTGDTYPEVRWHGFVLPQLRHRKSEPRPETGNRTKYRPYQRRRIHPHGDRRLQSLQKRRRWAYRCHQLHCRHQRIGHRPGLFRNETLPEYLHRSLGTTLPDATLEYPFHRHTPGFRRYRLTEKWQVPHAYASQSGSEEYRPCLEPEKTGHCD